MFLEKLRLPIDQNKHDSIEGMVAMVGVDVRRPDDGAAWCDAVGWLRAK